jgi:hypothetical protein
MPPPWPAAEHHGDYVVEGESLRRGVGNRAALAHDSDPVREAEHLGDIMRDHDDRETPRGGGSNRVVDDPGLLGTERGGRLVHEDRRLGPHHCARHCDRLALAAGKVAHGAVDTGERTDTDTAQCLLGACAHLAAV